MLQKRKWNWSKSQEKQKLHSQVFQNLIYFHWHKLMNNTFVNYFCITSFPLYFVGRWGVLLSRSITILRSIKSSLISCPQLSIYAFSRLVFIITISIYILHTVLYIFPKVLTRRICLTIKTFYNWWPFPLFSWR